MNAGDGEKKTDKNFEFFSLSCLILAFVFLFIVVIKRINAASSDPVKVSILNSKTVLAGSTLIVGNANRRFQIVEFFDYECPPCRLAQLTIDNQIDKFKNQIGYSVQNYPLKFHTRAKPCALIALSLENLEFTDFRFKALTLEEKKFDLLIKNWQSQLVKRNPNWKFLALCKLQDSLGIAEIVGLQSTPTIFIVDTLKNELWRCPNPDYIESALKRLL